MRLKKLMMATLFFALFAGIIGCGGSYVADIAGDKISVEDFEQVYAKNNGGPETAAKTSVEDRQKFLDLYVKFRLKVKEAYAVGYNNDAELRNELNDYRKNLGVAYLLEKEITKPALEQMYQRKLKQVRASHILIGVPSSKPEDTLLGFNIGKAIIDSLKLGYSFEQLAVNNSKDPSVKNNKGDIYYFNTLWSVSRSFNSATAFLENSSFIIARTTIAPCAGAGIIQLKSIKFLGFKFKRSKPAAANMAPFQLLSVNF